MHFKPEARIPELPDLLREFVKIAGRERWEKRLTWLDREERRETGMRLFWRERCGLDLAFWPIWQRCRKSGQVRVDRADPAAFRFLAFAAMVVHCHRRLTPQGKKRLAGMLADATNRDFGLGSVAYEMEVAAHLMSRGYDVVFHDLEGGEGFDFLADKDGVSMEVECKFMSGDAGRKIHLKELYRFGDRAATWMRRHLDGLTTGMFVQLTIPGRLEPNDEYQESLCSLLGCAMLSGDADFERNGTRARVRAFDVESVVGPWTAADDFGGAQIEAKLLDHFDLLNKNALVYIRPRQSVVAVLIKSTQKDQVLKAMHAELKKSTKNQFTGARPAVLCCHLAGLTQEQLLALGRDAEHDTGLDRLTFDLMLRRPHLYSVTYTAAGSAGRPLAVTGAAPEEAVTEKGLAYTVLNPDNPLAGAEQLSVFLKGWPPSTSGRLG